MATVTVDTDDLATLSALSRQLDVGRTTLIMWEKNDPSFPRPVIDIPHARLFSIAAVTAWFEANVA